MTTIKDLAKLAGVSVTTVSRALNGYDDVNEKTRARIKRLAQEANYYPNAVARSLVTKKTRTLGVVMSDINRAGVKDAVAYEILCGLNDRASELDYDILLFSASSKKQAKKSYLDLCKERNVDGAVFVGMRLSDPHLQELSEQEHFPCVTIDMKLAGKMVGTVTTNNVESAKLAVRHLAELGHREIAMINGHDEAAVSRDRLRGFREALAECGLAYREERVYSGNFSEEGGYEAMHRIMQQHPEVTAVFSASDLMVLGAIRAVERLGRKVPDSISIVGYDDITIAAYCSPRLTTIRQNKYELGYNAAQMLIDMLEGRSVDRELVLLNELVVRESAAPLIS